MSDRSESILTITKCRLGIDAHSKEVQEIKSEVFNLINSIATDISTDDKTAYLSFQPLISGSVGEGTKC